MSSPAPSNAFLTIFAKCLPKSMDEDALKHLFGQHGTIKGVHIIADDNYPTNRAFVDMSSKEECEAAIKALNGSEDGLNGRIFVTYKRQSNSRSPSQLNRLPFHPRNQFPQSGSGRGNTLLKVANSTQENCRMKSPRMPFPRMPPPHQGRPYFQPHTGQFTPRGPRGQWRGPPHGYRPNYPSFRPPYQGGPRYPPYFVQQQQNHVPRPGTPSTQFEPAAAQVSPLAVEASESCLHCNKPTTLRCSACKKAAYCSKECQTAHWGISHKQHCQQMQDQPTPSADVDLSEFSVSIHPNIIATLKELPAVAECLENLKDSDTESVTSTISEDPGLPLDESLKVKLTDFLSPSQFYVERTDNPATPGTLPRVWECALHGLKSSSDDNKWSDKAIDVCSSAGLALGGLCTILCYGKKNGAYQTKVTLRNGTDLAERLVSEGFAQLAAGIKYSVSTSLHTPLEPGQSIQLLIDVSSIKGVTDFYAQVTHKSCIDQLTKFTQMQPKLSSYARHIANKPPPGYRAQEGDYVLAPYENEWFRGVVTACNNDMAVVAYIDYGNISPIIHAQLVPLPRQFADVPALAVLCKLHGLSEATNPESQKKSVELIKSLATSNEKTLATVRSITEGFITVDLFDSNGGNLAKTLLSSGYAVGDGANTSLTVDVSQVIDELPGEEIPNDMPPLVEDMPPLLSTNDSKPQLPSANENMPPLAPAKEDMPTLQPAKEKMPPLLTNGDDHPAASGSDSSKSNTQTSSSVRKREGGLARQKQPSAQVTKPNRSVTYEKDIPKLTLDLSAKTSVLLTNASDLRSVHIIPAEQESLQHFLKGMEMISQQYLSDSNLKPPAEPLLEGEVLFALEPVTEDWDRVVVLNYFPNQPMVRVRSLDYGPSYYVDIKNVREMISQATLLVARAVHVKLAGLAGILNAEGKSLFSTFVDSRVFVTSERTQGEPVCDMQSEDGRSINELLKSYVTSSVNNTNGLDSHGSSSDGSLPTSSSAAAGQDTAESRTNSLEKQINAARSEVKLLKQEIALLRQHKSKPRKKVDENVEEFTL